MIPASRWRGWPLRSGTCRPPYGGQREWLAHGRHCVGRGIPLGAWQLAAFRVSEGLDAQLGRFAFDLGNLAVSAFTSAE